MDFEEIIKKGHTYVDKTEHYHFMINTGTFYFLSRSKGFGKSLTISTLDALFKGKKDLFRGLYIHDKYDFKEYPVLNFDISAYKDTKRGLLAKLKELFLYYGIEYEEREYPDEQLQFLIEMLAKRCNKGIVVLVDNYDYPFLHSKDDLSYLSDFFSVLKSSGDYIKFCFIAGKSPIQNTPLLVGVNHLIDINMAPSHSSICGFTQKEIEHYFGVGETGLKGYRFSFKAEDRDLIYKPSSVLAKFCSINI